VKDKLISQLKERSPQTTAELAKEVKGSWHRAQENLLELCLDGKVRRMIVGGRYLWFLETKKKGLSAQTRLIPIFVALLILSQAVILAQLTNSTANETFMAGEFAPTVQTNSSNSIIVTEVMTGGVIPVPATNSSNATDAATAAAAGEILAAPSSSTTEYASALGGSGANYTAGGTSGDMPHLVATISNYRVTRGDQIVIVAAIRNDGTGLAERIDIVWQLPAGLQTVGQSDTCDSLQPGEECSASITLATDDVGIGKNTAKIVLNYE
jgi:hypothetical protein